MGTLLPAAMGFSLNIRERNHDSVEAHKKTVYNAPQKELFRSRLSMKRTSAAFRVSRSSPAM